MFQETSFNAVNGMIHSTLSVSPDGNEDPRNTNILIRGMMIAASPFGLWVQSIIIFEWSRVGLGKTGMDMRSLLKIAERFLFSNRCKFCETPIPVGDAFCPKCGRSQV